MDRAERLVDLRETYRGRLQGSRSRAGEVVDLLFENPVVTARSVARRLNVTTQGALNLIRQLEALGALDEWTPVPGRAKRWLAAGVLRVLEDAAPGPDRPPGPPGSGSDPAGASQHAVVAERPR